MFGYYRMCVLALGLVMLSSVIGAMILSADGMNPPQMVITMGAAAAGSLAGLLIPRPSANNHLSEQASTHDQPLNT